MSKFSSFKKDQMLFENWRRHVNEAAEAMTGEEEKAFVAVQNLDADGEKKVKDALNPLTEDGHTDVASAMRKMKVACENAEQLLEALSQMPQEGDLPSWWMSKATLAANYLSKMRDYLVYPSNQQIQLPMKEKKDPVSKEISKLIEKGTPRDQAVAIALSMEKRGDIKK